MKLPFNLFPTIKRKQTNVNDNDLSNSMQKYITSLNLGWQWGQNEFEKQLTTADNKRAYYNCPEFYRGVNKKTRDMLFYGFKIDSPLDGVDVPDELENLLMNSLKDLNILNIMSRCIREAWAFGDGWYEYNCNGSKDPSTPLSGKLISIKYVDPDSIIGYKLNENKTMVEYWVYKNKTSRIPIHYTRLEHFIFNQNGDYPFGIGIAEIAHNSIQALINATRSLNDNMLMFGHPFPVVKTTDNTNKKQVEDAYSVLQQIAKKSLKVGFAGYRDTSFEMLNPVIPSPEETLNHYYIELASALEIPMQLLTGSQMSKLTGNEIELNDYYKSVNSIQELYLTPVFNKIFKLLVGDRWRYQIYWNPLFVDESSEIENKSLFMEKIGMLYTMGVINVDEARQLLREYNVNIPENTLLDQPEQDDVDENEFIPVEEEKTHHIRKPSDEEIRIAQRLRELGEKELLEQEKRCKKS